MVKGWMRIAAVLVALLLAAAGCGASDSAESAGEAVDETTGAVEADGADATDAGAENDGSSDADAADTDDATEADGETTWENYESPISAFLGVPSFVPGEDSEQQFVEQEREVQALVVECMSAQGFEYYPEDPERFADFSNPFDEDWGSEEWTKTWGFGVTTQAFGQSQVGPDLLGYPDDQIFPTEDELAEDPNQIYVASLSEGEIEAYYQVLYGNEPEITEDMTDEEIDELYMNWEPDGCYNEASEQVWNDGFDQEAMEAFDTEFGAELQEMYERIQAHPKIQAETDRINDCMIAAGQPTMPEDGDYWSLLYAEIEPLQEEVWASFDARFEEQFADDGTTDELGGVEEFDENADDFVFEQPELTDDQKARLGELQANELALATALSDCGGSAFGGFDSPVYFEVLAEVEQQFLDDNAAALEQYRGVYGE